MPLELKYFSPEFQTKYEKKMIIEQIKKDFEEIQKFIGGKKEKNNSQRQPSVERSMSEEILIAQQ